jgi:catechol 2,3-dioxygenase-like lactoylglutathione lyase family enzyme
MLGYAIVGSNNLEAAKAFYGAFLGAMGVTKMFDHPSGGAIYARDGQLQFGVLGPHDGQPHAVGNGQMTAFQATSNEDVKRLHALGLSLGGSNEGDPGPRGGDNSPFFGAYLRDLDGNKLCVFYWNR